MISFTMLLRLLVPALLVWSLVACTVAMPTPPSQPQACMDDDKVLNVGFYTYFEPVSYSASGDPAAADFNTHRGYEADLLSALETMENTGLSFARSGIAAWDGIWLQSAQPQFDMVGGGITILELPHPQCRRRKSGGLYLPGISSFGSPCWCGRRTLTVWQATNS